MRLLRTPLRPHARHQLRSSSTHLHIVPSALVVAAGLVAAVAGTGTANAEAPRSVTSRNVASTVALDGVTVAQVAVNERAGVEKRGKAIAAAKAKADAKAKAQAKARAKAKAAARARAAAHAKAVAHANAVARARASARAKAAQKTITRSTYSAPAAHPAVSGGAASLNWSALAQCEASGNPAAYNAAGYYGLYQFDVQTWHSMGGQGLPNAASASEQTYRAQLLYKQRGSSPWPVCGARLFS